MAGPSSPNPQHSAAAGSVAASAEMATLLERTPKVITPGHTFESVTETISHASSGCQGTPIFRTRYTSNSAPSASATIFAKGTPPRGSPSTRTSGSSRNLFSFAANTCPAWVRS